jgi:hypothetical protein
VTTKIASSVTRKLPEQKEAPKDTKIGTDINSVIPADAKRLSRTAHIEGDHWDMSGKKIDDSVKLGAPANSEFFVLPQGKVTAISEEYDTDGDGRADLEKDMRLDGRTFVRPTAWDPAQGVWAADHNGDGKVDSFTQRDASGEVDLVDQNYDGKVDLVREDVKRLPDYKAEGFGKSVISNEKLAMRIQEDTDRDGKLDTESVTAKRGTLLEVEQDK